VALHSDGHELNKEAFLIQNLNLVVIGIDRLVQGELLNKNEHCRYDRDVEGIYQSIFIFAS
jgi:hypothetical protein